jgi:hypothetical protein
MLYLIAILIVIGIIWYFARQRGLTASEQQYLRRRGYETEEETPGPPVPKDAQLFNLIASLNDLSPYARQKAAEDLAQLCRSGRRDPRMLSALVAALDDRDANVRSAAATALAMLALPQALEPLQQRLAKEESIQARKAINRAIEKLEGNRQETGG